ncbi:cupin domain-containing protein [Candidatus Woesearchaeota archaeon]|nr:cupin domain-containing protein [Candidatus Woesearchaeota archaeon]
MKIIRLKDIQKEEKNGYSIKRLFTLPLSKKPDNVGLYETTIPLGSVCGHHYHENLDEIIFFLTKGRIRSNDKIYDVEPGDLLFLYPGDKHEFIADDNEIRLIAIKLPNIVDDKVKC